MTTAEFDRYEDIYSDMDMILDHEKLTNIQLSELIENMDELKGMGFFDYLFTSGRIDYEDVRGKIIQEIFNN